MGKDIFISYKNDGEGNNFAARICSDLERLGYEVYYNPNEQHAGSFPDRLKNAVESCKDFLLIVTQPCLEQLMRHDKIDWIREELLTAYRSNKNIIPLLMPGVSMPKDKEDMPEDLRFLPDKDAVSVFEPYDKSPFENIVGWMKSLPINKEKYRDVFQSNNDYNVNEDFANTLKQAESGDEKAMYEIANMYFYGFTNEDGQSKRDFSKAYSWFTRLSNSDSPYGVFATSMLGKMHYRGVVPKEKQSFVKSFECHKKAAQGGSEYSKQQYAFMLSMGMGCNFDYDAAEQQYLSAMEHGDNVSISGLAKFYIQYGEFKKAENLYKNIVDTYPMAAYELGCLYMKGLLSEDKKPDCFKAAFYFQHAINTGNGDMDARYQLGLLYFRGTNGFINDYKIAQENFEVAADGGHVASAYMVGYMYEHGHVELNLEKAIYYHALAADHGHVLSPTHLAILYQLPEHQNYHKAIKYAKLAASHGEKEGEFVYGNLLFFGRGCEPNNNEAYKMYKRALEHGCDQAAFMIERIESRQLAEDIGNHKIGY